MKILIISDAWKPQMNGVVRTYEYLVPELEKRGHTVRIIGPADFPHRFSLPGYKEIELVLFPYRRLAAMIDAFAPDTIHLATEAPLGRAGRKYCRRKDLRYTSCYHTHFPDYIAKRMAKWLPFLYRPVKALAFAVLRRFHNGSSALMIATDSLARELRERGFTAPLYPFTRGVLLGLFRLKEPRLNPSPLYPDAPRPVALYVGRVAIEKNIGDFAEMKWDGTKIVVGDGPGMAALRKSHPEIIFAGRQTGEDLADHYNAADIFVFPSRTDTFGMVIVEAMACGLPVAAYDVTGPKDIVTLPLLGALTKNDLAEAARQALAVAPLRAERHDYVKTHYTWDVAAEQFLAACVPVAAAPS